MADSYRPETADQLRDLIAGAVAEKAPVEIVGNGTKRALGRPMGNLPRVELSLLQGVSLYEPGELVLSAGAGTAIAEIEALLDENGQRLAFEPLHMDVILGAEASAATLGGVISCNLAGPRRISAGAARDHILGVRGVTGRGETFKSGGRVVKNVTGYDMSKLMTGAYGTLGAISELTVKVLTKPEKTRTVLIFGLSDGAGVKALAQAAGSSHETSGLAHLPEAAAARSHVTYVRGAGGPVTAIRLEGPGPSVEHRCAALRRELAEFGETEELHGKNSSTLWREVRDAALLPKWDVLWRLSVTPSGAAKAVADTKAALSDAVFMEVHYDWAGGLIWLALKEAEDAAHEAVRAAVDLVGGHATLIRADEDTRRRVPVFHPQAPALAALNRRVKEQLDPLGIFNPGRMVEGT